MTLKVVGARPRDYMNLLADHEFKYLKYLKLIITEPTCLTELIYLAKARYVKQFEIEVVNKLFYITICHFFSAILNPKSYFDKVVILQILENELNVTIDKKTSKRKNLIRFTVVVKESQCRLDIKAELSNLKTISFSL